MIDFRLTAGRSLVPKRSETPCSEVSLRKRRGWELSFSGRLTLSTASSTAALVRMSHLSSLSKIESPVDNRVSLNSRRQGRNVKNVMFVMLSHPCRGVRCPSRAADSDKLQQIVKIRVITMILAVSASEIIVSLATPPIARGIRGWAMGEAIGGVVRETIPRFPCIYLSR